MRVLRLWGEHFACKGFAVDPPHPGSGPPNPQRVELGVHRFGPNWTDAHSR